MKDKDETIKLLMDIHTKVSSVDKTVAVQSKSIEAIKTEQIRQNKVVEEHERRSIASENRLGIVEVEHRIFKDEHKTFRDRIKVAEKPGLVLNNIWRALITLGAGAAAMLTLLKFLDYLKLP